MSSSTTPEAPKRRRESQRPEGSPLRQQIYDIIFEHDTPNGWMFDVALLAAILLSVALISLETVASLGQRYENFFWYSEWFLTILFTVEYGLRLYCVRNPLRYAFSFWGIIDLLSILPSYAMLFFTKDAIRSFAMIRSIRLLRVFRILKLWRMMDEADELSRAFWRARNKIVVFIAAIAVAVTISGTLMYYIETELPRIAYETAKQSDPSTPEPESQFTSIPVSMYWATVTMTTVGYGDVVAKTAAGKVVTTLLILLGYSLIIVPSGFVTAELTVNRLAEEDMEPITCPVCEIPDHRPDAVHCYRCGAKLDA